ncbi:hypothetical protein [Aestuariivirga litoralis]|uniref:hypothetical protein n=1 Tax=Aestuariivirga litoralis TaxID=2650924 RepID=UPI0018C57C36|nr:hypothetical protein [Aestuariivirga litoralis]MBG1232899.1 hypothetical protein [Aestuariivirga litoralis]
MNKFLIAAVTAGVLGLGLVSTQASAAQLNVGVGNNGVHVGVGTNGNRMNNNNRMYRNRMHMDHCRMVKVWKHHHRVWVKKCW